MVEKAFRFLGWLGGSITSLLLPRLTAPYGLLFDFQLSGQIAAITGFSLMYSSLTDQVVSRKASRIITLVSAVVGIVAWQIYKTLLVSPDNTTPDLTTQWLELLLFCAAHAAFFVVLAFAYKNGGELVLNKLLRKPAPDGGV